MSQYDEIPVLPEEATDLGVHVRECARRYASLTRHLDRMATRLNFLNVILSLFTGILSFILWKMMERLA